MGSTLIITGMAKVIQCTNTPIACTSSFLLRSTSRKSPRSVSCCRGRVVAASSSIATPPQVQLPLDTLWKEFADNASGEWDGYGADFLSSGAPLELPSSVVPEAFREWDVQVFDWQTQCPTLVEESLHYKLVRLLPTVGCEADAATQYSVNERHVADADSGATFLAFHTNGSYIAVWPGTRVLKENFGVKNSAKMYVTEGDKETTFEVEHCLVQEGDLRFRVRVLQKFAMQDSFEESRRIPVLTRVSVQREKWESEFRNGEVLGGCSTSGSAFATMRALQMEELTGTWCFETFAAESETQLNGVNHLGHVGSETRKRESKSSLLLLPKGIWSDVILQGDGSFSIGAGWLVDSGRAISSGCDFSNAGKGKRACITFETRGD